MATLIENSGTYAVYQNSDGSYFVEGNGEKEVIRDYGNIAKDMNIVAVDLFNGYRTVVFDGGHIWYADSDWSKENVGPNNQSVADSDFQATGQDYRDFYGVDLSYPNLTADDYYEDDSGDDAGGVPGGAPNDGLDEAALFGSAGPFQVIEAIGSFKLHYGTGNSTYWVEDLNGGGSWSLIKQMGGNDFPSGVDSIIAADYFNGVRAVLFSSPGTNPNDPGASYHIWYANLAWEKDHAGPSGLEATNISAAQVIENFGSVLPGYTGGSGISINNITDFANSTVVEGDSIWVTIRTDQAPVVSGVNYNISGSGINSSDIGIPLSGVVGVPNIQNSPLPARGTADYYALLEETGRSNLSSFSYPAHLIAVGDYRFEIPILEDSRFEGNEFLRLTIDTGFDTETKIISITESELNQPAVLSVSSNVSEIREDEGSVVFSIQTSGYDAGATVDYLITGVSSKDIVGGSLSGSALIDESGAASVSIVAVSDNITEAGGETLTLSVGDFSSSVTILDPIDEINNEDLANGSYTLDLIADVFGSVMFLDGLTETVTSTSHTIEYNGVTFDYEEVDGIITTVVRDGEFTNEFSEEIAESFPSAAGISYDTALALIGVSNMEATILMVAGFDGNYVG